MMLGVKVPAKVNLHLQLLGRRPDEYHELRTLMASIDLFDELRAEPAPDDSLDLRVQPADAVRGGEDNLVMIAARSLQEHVGGRLGARLELKKRIPVGAGLGGGSADAAATLMLLDRLWSLELPVTDLHALAGRIGSDVPFFLHGGVALGIGRGDEVYPLPDLPEFGIVVVDPGVEISTRAVYGRIRSRLTWIRHEANVYAFSAGFADQPCWERMVNDLQPVVLEGWPVVAEALADLEATDPLRVAVTGSGSAVFGIYQDRRSAERAAAELRGSRWKHVGVVLDRRRARMRVEEGRRWK
jgi:4-diphosphocytidyl-2-C-methyl-D-erythritol kinase